MCVTSAEQGTVVSPGHITRGVLHLVASDRPFLWWGEGGAATARASLHKVCSSLDRVSC